MKMALLFACDVKANSRGLFFSEFSIAPDEVFSIAEADVINFPFEEYGVVILVGGSETLFGIKPALLMGIPQKVKNCAVFVFENPGVSFVRGIGEIRLAARKYKEYLNVLTK